MRIGQLAQRAGIDPQTIRFYERKRVLPAPARTRSGYREYGERDLENLRVIRQCQQLGFTLKESSHLLRLHGAVAGPVGNGQRPHELGAILDLARQRLEIVDRKLKLLSGMKRELVRMIANLESQKLLRCPAADQESR